MSKAEKNGIICTILSGFFFSIGGVCYKFVPWAALAINATRHGISFIIMLIYLAVTHKKLHMNKVIFEATVCLFFCNVLYAFANKMTTAGNAIVLEYTSPIFVIILAWLVFGQKPDRLDLTATAAILLGIVCFFIDSLSTGHMLGDILSIVSGVAYAGMFIFNKMGGADPFLAIVWANLACFIFGLPELAKADVAVLDKRAVIALICLGVIQVAGGNIFFARGILTTPPVTASLLTTLEPILNPIWVALLYGEMLSPLSLVGVFIVLGTVTVYNVLKAKKEKKPA